MLMQMRETMLEREEGLAVLSIDLPEALSNLKTESMLEIMETLKKMREDSDIDVIVVAGAEDREMVRNAGMQNPGERKNQSPGKLKDGIFLMIESMKKPVSIISGEAQNGAGELSMLKEVLRGKICVCIK